MFSLHFRPDLHEEGMWPLVISDPCLVVYMCIPFAMMEYVPGSDTADVPVTALIHSQVNMHSYNQWKTHSLLKVKVDNDELSLHQAFYASLCPISRCVFNVQPHLYLCIINILTFFPVSESFWIAFDLHCGCSCFQRFLKVEYDSAVLNELDHSTFEVRIYVLVPRGWQFSVGNVDFRSSISLFSFQNKVKMAEVKWLRLWIT